MANNNWNNYTEKTATPVDADEVMVRDSADGKNKKLLFGTFWKWVAKKLNEATISELQTSNKTIVGALNQLNSETKKYISRAERIKTENNRIQYRITPTISDVSILCINRTGLYLITLSQTGGVFSNASIKKIYEGGNDAKIQIGEDRKNIIFECDIYSNPIFISTFK